MRSQLGIWLFVRTPPLTFVRWLLLLYILFFSRSVCSHVSMYRFLLKHILYFNEKRKETSIKGEFMYCVHCVSSSMKWRCFHSFLNNSCEIVCLFFSWIFIHSTICVHWLTVFVENITQFFSIHVSDIFTLVKVINDIFTFRDRDRAEKCERRRKIA